MYEARKISNFLLAEADAHALKLTNLRLNKLLYFIHGRSLVTYSAGVIRNHFEAWQYGPVIRAVYDTFKKFDDKIIDRPATFLDYSTGQQTTIPHNDIREADKT